MSEGQNWSENGGLDSIGLADVLAACSVILKRGRLSSALHAQHLCGGIHWLRALNRKAMWKATTYIDDY